jgi:hypothetical protein
VLLQVESALEDETGSLQVEGGELAVRALYTWPDRKTTRLRYRAEQVLMHGTMMQSLLQYNSTPMPTRLQATSDRVATACAPGKPPATVLW